MWDFKSKPGSGIHYFHPYSFISWNFHPHCHLEQATCKVCCDMYSFTERENGIGQYLANIYHNIVTILQMKQFFGGLPEIP